MTAPCKAAAEYRHLLATVTPAPDPFPDDPWTGSWLPKFNPTWCVWTLVPS
jgi:hypothetical protein